MVANSSQRIVEVNKVFWIQVIIRLVILPYCSLNMLILYVSSMYEIQITSILSSSLSSSTNFLSYGWSLMTSWTGYLNHVNMVNSKLSKCIEIINKEKHKLKVSSLKLLYHTFFECHFNYSINLWRNTFPSNISLKLLPSKRE